MNASGDSKEEKRDPASKLEPAQLSKLADELQGSKKNVFSLCQHLFGIEVGDGIFDRLQHEESLFRCERCDRWLAEEHLDNDIDVTCVDCANEGNVS